MKQVARAPLCPSCGRARSYRDGLRYLFNGRTVQRWICRNCGYRFTEKVPKQTPQEHFPEPINSADDRVTERQVCELLAEESKNLTETTRQETAQREGTLQTTAAKGRIIEHVLWLQKQGYKESTIVGRSRLLETLAKRGADLLDPESIKLVIAKQGTWSEGRKELAAEAYTTFLRTFGGKWEKPRYKRVQRVPWIPTESEIDQLIAAASPRIGTFLLLLKETGMRPGEAWKLRWIDLDTVAQTINVTAEKNSNPRIFKLSGRLTERMSQLAKTSDRIFGKTQQEHFRQNFSLQRRTITNKLKSPRLMQISFKTFRHWKATMEYHRTKDILHVMNVLGHKNIKNTLVYTHLAEEIFKGQDDYVSKVAKNEHEACVLVDAGFDYVCDFDGHKIFRKRKY